MGDRNGSGAERRLNVGWGELSALHWANTGAPRVLCLHGWMDNAASFAALAPLLDGLDVMALDLAGHGRSDHRPRGAHYYVHEYVFDLDAALDALGWDQCALVGHSLGTGIASAYAAAAPERVSTLVLLDGLGLLAEPGDRAAARLRRSLASVREPRAHRRRYADIDAAARARLRQGEMTLDAARQLVQRALVATDDGHWRWRTDAGIRWESPYWASEAAAQDLLSALTCPVLSLTTPVLSRYLGEHFDQRLSCIDPLVHQAIDLGHHFHMDEPATHAPLIRDFLLTHGAPS